MAAASLMGVGFALLAAAALAGQSLLVRISSKRHAVIDIIAVMFLLNVLVLVPATVVRQYPRFTLTPVAVASFAIGGLLGSLLGRFYLFEGIERLGASRAEPLKSTFPLISVVVAVLVLNESVPAVIVLGTLLLIGGAIAITREAQSSPITATGRQIWVDVSYPLLAAVFLGIDPIFSKVGFAEGTSPLVGLSIRLVAAAGGFWLYLLWRRSRSGSRLRLPFDRWVVLASAMNTGYLAAYFVALSSAPVSVVTPIIGVSPLLVVLGAAAFIQRDERVTYKLVIAAGVIALGVALILRG